MSYQILIVDDEVAVRETLCELLKKEGCLALSCSTGEEALALLAQQKFDILLLDIKLAEVSGLEVLKDIRQIYKDLPVVMITGFGYDEDLITKSKQLGCSGYIGKNMAAAKIITTIKQFIKNAHEKSCGLSKNE